MSKEIVVEKVENDLVKNLMLIRCTQFEMEVILDVDDSIGYGGTECIETDKGLLVKGEKYKDHYVKLLQDIRDDEEYDEDDEG